MEICVQPNEVKVTKAIVWTGFLFVGAREGITAEQITAFKERLKLREIGAGLSSPAPLPFDGRRAERLSQRATRPDPWEEERAGDERFHKASFENIFICARRRYANLTRRTNDWYFRVRPCGSMWPCIHKGSSSNSFISFFSSRVMRYFAI